MRTGVAVTPLPLCSQSLLYQELYQLNASCYHSVSQQDCWNLSEACRVRGNLPDCLFCLCGAQLKGFVLNLHSGSCVIVPFDGSVRINSKRNKQKLLESHYNICLLSEKKSDLCEVRRMCIPGSTLDCTVSFNIHR